jgi:Leucine-rich repeat (LRR) protein
MIRGTLPTEFGVLANLREVNLTQNLVTGEIPKQFQSMSALEELSLSDNAIQGSLPTDLGLMSSLRQFSVASNRLDGRLFSELGQLTKLSLLELQQNVSRRQPRCNTWGSYHHHHCETTSYIYSNCSVFHTVFLTIPIYSYQQNISGSIPSEIGNLRILRLINVTGNDALSGQIPDVLCENTLVALDCSDTLCGCDCDCA